MKDEDGRCLSSTHGSSTPTMTLVIIRRMKMDADREKVKVEDVDVEFPFSKLIMMELIPTTLLKEGQIQILTLETHPLHPYSSE